jgi:hypothetical protein
VSSPFGQQSLDRMEKDFDGLGETRIFLIEDKEGSKLGYIAHFDSKGCKGIGSAGNSLMPKRWF